MIRTPSMKLLPEVLQDLHLDQERTPSCFRATPQPISEIRKSAKLLFEQSLILMMESQLHELTASLKWHISQMRRGRFVTRCISRRAIPLLFSLRIVVINLRRTHSSRKFIDALAHVYRIKHFLLFPPFRVKRAALVADSKTSRTPWLVFAEHSRYL